MIEDMQIRNFSPRTIKCYAGQVARFARHFGTSPERLGPEQIRQYQLYLVQVKKASWSSFNQTVCALKFLYKFTLPQDWNVVQIPFAKLPKKLPVVLSREEVQRVLACVRNPQHRLLLSLIYAAGLRLNEATQLKAGDIDSQRMRIHVRCGKGAKARQAVLAARLVEPLRQHARLWQLSAEDWLFPSRRRCRPIDGSTIQTAVSAGQKAGDRKRDRKRDRFAFDGIGRGVRWTPIFSADAVRVMSIPIPAAWPSGANNRHFRKDALGLQQHESRPLHSPFEAH
jgi:site-specific recombinase XerD